MRYAKQPSIECKYCGCRINKVTDSHKREVTYHGKKRTIIKRYRKCNHCGLQFTTIETYEDEDNTNLPEDIAPFKPAPPPSGVYSQPKIPRGDAAGSLPPEKPKASSRRKPSSGGNTKGSK